MQSYVLFDLESGNLIGSYASLDDAYQVVREGIRNNGERSAGELALFEIDGESQEMLEAGQELMESVFGPSGQSQDQE